ncbi:G-type lectin S-receptor-like serine/threonine-protein kinase [Senna tora]|uniref:G-type lectin S-receptor-like serine/threonine-protein kinase n=1 Tax=Senna tora TaxID=362788 RepID=A0A834XD47_9FABA|nr:G-type lectin S-receptor-like serine/threonine-protein kinase [Senna tora]
MATVISMLHSEIIDIPPPRQPAFIHKQTMPCSENAIQICDELCSINAVPITNLYGR